MIKALLAALPWKPTHRWRKPLSEKGFAEDLAIDETASALVHSLEGGIYLLEVLAGDRRAYLVSQVTGQPVGFNALHEAKHYARRCGIRRIALALETPYDQMIGLRSVAG